MAPRKYQHTSVAAILLRHPDDDDQGTGDGGGSGDGGDDALGEPGRRALEEERKARRAAERTAREAQNQLNAMQQQLDELTRRSMTDAERQLAEQLEQRTAEVRREVEQQAAERIAAAERKVITARLQAAAAGKIVNPADVAVFVQIDDLERDASGEVTDAAIAASIESLLRDRPYLGAKPGGGSADQGRVRDAPPNLRDPEQLRAELAKLGVKPK